MIGYSLSLCVRDIIQGKVDVKDVKKIVASTCAYNQERWEKLLDMYCNQYWRHDPDKARLVVATLKARDAIEQPRIDDSNYYRRVNPGEHWEK